MACGLCSSVIACNVVHGWISARNINLLAVSYVTSVKRMTIDYIL